MSKKVGIWIRVSTDMQKESNSPQHHEERAKAYCAIKGWEITEIYNLSGVSGKSVSDHPECQRMLKDIERKHIEALVFSKLDRLARSVKQLLHFSEFFEANQADLVSLSESIDTSSSSGKMLFTILSAFAEFERQTIADRVAKSVEIRSKLGKSLGGQAPFGYRWVQKELQINEDEAPIRRLMYELFVEHKRKGTVCRILNERGYRTRNGSKFTATTLERLLIDTVAIGKRRVNYTKSLGDKKHWVEKPEDEWVYHEVPALISESLWQQVQEILIKQKKTQSPRRKSVHLFSGITFCQCGTKMYVLSNSPKYVCQNCRNKIPKNDLEALFISEMKGVVLDQHFTAQHQQTLQEKINEKERLLEEQQKSSLVLQKKLDQLLELQLAGELPKAGFKQHYEPLFEQKEQTQKSIPLLEQDIAHLQKQQRKSTAAIENARDIYSNWEHLDKQSKKLIIEIVVEKIIIGTDTVEFIKVALPLKDENDDNNEGNTSSSLQSSSGLHTSTKEEPSSFNSLQIPHASTRIHRGYQHEGSREVDTKASSTDGYLPFFHRLSHYF
jgi:site-specific DNA recombinase